MKKILINFLCLLIVASVIVIIFSKRERSLVVKTVQLELSEIIQDKAIPDGWEKNDFLIKDVDSYGRNWTVWVVDQYDNAIVFSIYSKRGIGPISIFNTLNTLKITNKDIVSKDKSL